MPNEYALIGLVHPAARSERPTQPDSAMSLRTTALAAASRLRARILRVVRRVTRLLRLWRRRIAESNELRAMSDRDLQDFGISRYDAEHEAKRAFWKASREQW